MSEVTEREEFEAAQNDPGFKAWLAMMEFQIEEFITFDLPSDLPDDPFTTEALRVAGRVALQRFQSFPDDPDEADRTFIDRCARLIGESFVQRMGGTWVYSPGTDGSMSYVGVSLPTATMPILPFQLVEAAIFRRDADLWARVLGFAEEDAGLRESTRVAPPSGPPAS